MTMIPNSLNIDSMFIHNPNSPNPSSFAICF